MAHFEFDEAFSPEAKIKVIGVGGAGGNALNTMIEAQLPGLEFIAANTDVQALERNRAPVRVQLGRDVTRGLGAGADPNKGRQAAIESVADLAAALEGADMVFVTAGMGGGTGTGAAAVIAQTARECGALTVGVVTKPFQFEGARRMRLAIEGIAALESAVDTLITIPNERLLTVVSQNTTLIDAFSIADEVLLHATQGVSELITNPGIVNVDFADVRAIMAGQGRALMGMGIASDEGRATAAAHQAINSPLLEDISIEGARGILINVTAGPGLKLAELNEAASLIQEAAHPDANIIFGTVIDPNMGDALRLTVIATGFEHQIAAEERLAEAMRAANTGRRRQLLIGAPAPTPAPTANPLVSGRRPAQTPAAMPAPGSHASFTAGAAATAKAAAMQAAATQLGLPSHGGSGVWGRGEVDPHEVPAFLRRRDEIVR